MSSFNRAGDQERIDEKREFFSLRCYSCSSIHPVDDYGRRFYYCTSCGGLLEIKITPFEDRGHGRGGFYQYTPKKGVWKYSDLIPLWSEKYIISMQEGSTPLIKCDNLASFLGLGSLYVKFEGLNPTGSFKDRGMTVGVSKAKELGFRRVICASTGNTSASLAAYAARANLSCTVLVPKGKIAIGKIAQALAYGSKIAEIDGNFDDCLRVATEYCERDREALLLNSLNPFRIEGQKTTAFEITEELGTMPDNIVLPMGNGGNISSIWKGFKEIAEFSLYQEETDGALPRIMGVQAEGAAPIARAFLKGASAITPIKDPYTAATAINIGSPVNWARALGALYESRGLADFVDDEEILTAQKLLASKEGLFVEPASAVTIAFLSKISGSNDSALRARFDKLKESSTVCIATGNGLKDPDAVIKSSERDGNSDRFIVSTEPDSLQKILLKQDS